MEWLAVAVGEVPWAGGVVGDLDAAVVDDLVVVLAQQAAGVDVGGAVVAVPVLGVVDLGHGGWGVAAGVLAVAVAGDDGAAFG
ncbi:hypothetical protein, partial [Cellulomonas sp. P5_C6]